jgi:hypothetical protein
MEPHDLYGLPLERFTEERNSLAKQLRGKGERDQAATVAKLRKPSAAAWAVNQLVRTQRRDVDSLFKAGDALQRAQAELLAKRGDAAKLRKAVDEERLALEPLVEKARGLLGSDGHELTPARLGQVSDTLHAAALDQDARAQVRDGRLERELRHVGLGALTAGASEPRGRTKSRGSSKPAAGADEAKQRKARRSAARKAESDARRRLERAVGELRAVEQRRQRAEVELQDADEALATAHEVADEAAQQHKDAQQKLDRLG